MFVDLFSETSPPNPAELARAICHRRTGVGADGLILVGPSDHAAARMQIYNADGSSSGVCGNALRCVIRLLTEMQSPTGPLTIETGHGVVSGELVSQTGDVRVEMGRPILDAASIPCAFSGTPPLNVPVEIGGQTRRVSCVSMGNPHCILFDAQLDDVTKVGPLIENQTALFPERINVEFVEIRSRHAVRARVWERGVGETPACGSGACAIVVAGVLMNRLDRQCAVQLNGGTLHIDWSEDQPIFMTGPTAEVFRGRWSSRTGGEHDGGRNMTLPAIY